MKINIRLTIKVGHSLTRSMTSTVKEWTSNLGKLRMNRCCSNRRETLIHLRWQRRLVLICPVSSVALQDRRVKSRCVSSETQMRSNSLSRVWKNNLRLKFKKNRKKKRILMNPARKMMMMIVNGLCQVSGMIQRKQINDHVFPFNQISSNWLRLSHSAQNIIF